MTTHVVMIVDMSGSMSHLAEDVRGGFNSYVEGLRADTAATYSLTATLFDTEFIPLAVALPLAEVPELTTANYVPRGMTALLDAVGKTVAEFHLRVPALAADDRVLVVIQTDGAENSSREYTWAQIQKLIQDHEATSKWSFIYLGAGADTWAQAHRMGVLSANYVNPPATTAGTASSYAGVTMATMAYTRGSTGAEAAEVVRETLGPLTPILPVPANPPEPQGPAANAG